MPEPLWRLLMKEPSSLSCDECFAVLAFYADVLAKGGPALLPDVMERLEGCPQCPAAHHHALERLEIAYDDEQVETE